MKETFDPIWILVVSYVGIHFPKATLHLKSYQSISRRIVPRGCLTHLLRYYWTQHYPNTRSLKKVQTLPFLTITLLNHLLITYLTHNMIFGYHHKPPCIIALIVHILYNPGIFYPFFCMLSGFVLSYRFFIRIYLP